MKERVSRVRVATWLFSSNEEDSIELTARPDKQVRSEFGILQEEGSGQLRACGYIRVNISLSLSVYFTVVQ